MFWYCPGKNVSLYKCFTLETLKNLSCHVRWALQYLATNRNLQSVCPDTECECPHALINKRNQETKFERHGILKAWKALRLYDSTSQYCLARFQRDPDEAARRAVYRGRDRAHHLALTWTAKPN